MTFKVHDYYFKKAKEENFLARSVYKLEEINKKYKVLKKNDVVLDLGYYPGSWIQYTSSVIGAQGKILGVDLQEVNKDLAHLKNVSLIQEDVFALTPEKVAALPFQFKLPFDVVLSDMAPKTSGIRSVDQDRSLDLVQKIFTLLPHFLKKSGNIVIKVFASQIAQDYLKEQKKQFKDWHYLRPASTRSCSKEFFVIGKGYLASGENSG